MYSSIKYTCMHEYQLHFASKRKSKSRRPAWHGGNALRSQRAILLAKINGWEAGQGWHAIPRLQPIYKPSFHRHDKHETPLGKANRRMQIYRKGLRCHADIPWHPLSGTNDPRVFLEGAVPNCDALLSLSFFSARRASYQYRSFTHPRLFPAQNIW